MKEMTLSDSSQPRSVYEQMIAVLLNFQPVEDLDEIVHDTFLGYGTAAHEFFRNREEVAEMARMQADQLRDQNFDLTRKPIYEQLLADGTVCLIVEEMNMFMHASEHRLALRLSTLLELKDGKWLVTHFHGSTPDSNIAEVEAFPMEGLRRKNEELEAKIRERTRELEIEAALERVRTRAMAMHKTEELNQVLSTVMAQLQDLGFPAEAAAIIIIDEDLAMEHWMTGYSGEYPESYKVPYVDHPYFTGLLDGWKDQIPFKEFYYEGDLKIEFSQWLLENSGFRKMPPEFKKEMLNPARIVVSETYNKYGMLEVISQESLAKDAISTLKRFSKVFEQAYTRFLDLQKAEAQAREAQIEAALERVRAQAMAMRHSDDLVQSTAIVFEELEKLNLSIERSGIGIFNAASRDCELWTTVVGKDGEKELATGVTSLTVHPMLIATFEAWETQQPLSYVLEGEELADYYKKVAKSDFVLSEEVIGKSVSLDREFYHYSPFGAGGLYFFSESEPTQGDKKIIRRFAEVFDLTYTRFLDLQKAEAQAREAQIEAALERVRSRSMAMHKSEELAEVATVLYHELLKLEVGAFSVASIVVLDEPNNQQIVWGSQTESEALQKSIMPLLGDQVLQKIYDKWLSGEALFSVMVGGVALEKHKDFVFPRAERTELVDRFLKNMPDPTFFHCAVFSMGYLELVSDRELPDESAFLLKRFAKVFEQTYTRFLDLQRAEKQAREARIEMALERVRAGMMAMHKSDELRLVIKTIFEQLQELDFGADASAVIIYDENYAAEHWFSGYSYQTYPKSYTIPYIEKFAYNTDLVDAWKKGVTFQAFPMEGTKKTDYGHWLLENTDFKDLPEEFTIHAITPDRLVLNDAFNKYGMLEVLGPEELAPENAEILNRFSKVFEQTYTRFLDLKKAEAQAREAQIETALERVRSRTMGMQTSDELREVVLVINEQLDKLDFGSNACNIIVIDRETGDSTYWVSGFTKDIYPVSYHVPYLDHPYYEALLNPWKRGDRYVVYEYSGQDKKDFEKISFAKSGFRDVPAEAKKVMKSLPFVVLSTAYFSNGALQVIGPEALSEDKALILQRFAKVFDQTYTRFLDLQKAEAQAREAQVETALERVRSRTMGMQTSDELQDAANELFRQVEILGMPVFGCGFNIWDPGRRAATAWMARKDRMQPPFKTSSSEDIFARIHKAAGKGVRLFVEEQVGKALQDHYAYMVTIPTFRDIVQEMATKGLTTPEFQVMHCAFFSQGYLMFISHEPVPDFHEIFKRFAGVFEQTYTRFLDLKRAELQAREAQIETALERVRSRSMAMQTSEELQEVIRVIFEQLALLNIHAEHAGIVVDYQPGQDWHFWVADKQDIPSKITVPFLDLPWDRQFTEAKKKGADFFTTHLNFEEKNSFYQQLLPHIAGVTPKARDFYFSCPGLAASTVLQDDIGLYIENFSGNPYSEEENSILRRFGKVFQQTYTRFLDLQRAEAQARQAKIEAALEKVRARTMAMQHSDELAEASHMLDKEVRALGIETWGCAFNIYRESDSIEWFGNEAGLLPTYTVPRVGIFKQYYEMGQQGETLYVKEISGEECVEHYEFMCTLPVLGDVLRKLKETNGAFPSSQTDHVVYFKYGYLLFITREAVPEAYDIFKRFTAVFEQTYTRFLDLKRAEAQAREARIETALERVRARALAMQQPEELKDVARVLRHEMGLLGVEELETSSIYINDEEARKAECWYAIKDIRAQEKVLVADHFALDLNATWVGREMLKFYESGSDQVSIAMKGKQRREWIDYCEAHSEPFRGYYGEVVPDRTYHLYKFSHGAIGVATDGDLSEESWQLLRRAASVFSLAYSRFRDLTQARLDLQLLKEEKKRAEDALAELQHTQKQLVHAEKMASLGELTAGIAHEIQNPLNFVNNFSEVSRELLEEMIEELKKGDAEEADAIARDVIQNLEKIVHHGRRADGIVKGMLQHSRSGDGLKQPTYLNKLADEYLRLAYHGLRAKDKSFNATLETNFDPSIGEVELIPQDIGRVLLNLLTNAFHAVSEKKKETPEGYEPTLTVSTHKTEHGVEITVRDNGNGIPNGIKDKIFQPFFTTKPTGQGTGLGLSMSYDIVTKGHGGSLKVESQEGAGSKFMVILPV